jgi:hypothetical protein
MTGKERQHDGGGQHQSCGGAEVSRVEVRRAHGPAERTAAAGRPQEGLVKRPSSTTQSVVSQSPPTRGGRASRRRATPGTARHAGRR